MIKKILSIIFVLIGLFFLVGFFALINSILWGSIFCGVVSIGCFYMAYRLYPRKAKVDPIIPPTIEEVGEEPRKVVKSKTEIKLEPEIIEEVEVIPIKTEPEPYSLNSAEFKEIGETTISYFEKIKQYSLNCNSLTEKDGNNLSDFKYEIETTREKLPENTERFSIRLLNEIFLAMYDVCADLEYYIEDKDQTWIEDISLKVDTITQDFTFLTEIIKGEMND